MRALVIDDSRAMRMILKRIVTKLNFEVTEAGDGVELWGTASVHDDLETKRRLWEGVFDYDLNLFAPGGPDGSPGMGFLAVEPERAIAITQYGIGGIDHWRRS